MTNRHYINHLNEKIESLYIQLSTLQQNNSINFNKVEVTTTIVNIDKLIFIINDIEKYKNTHVKYLKNQSNLITSSIYENKNNHYHQLSSSINDNHANYIHEHDDHPDHQSNLDNNNNNQLPSAIVEDCDDRNGNNDNDGDDDYTLVNEVLNDCYKKCATFIRLPYT